jgi:CRP/FNR family cyclic AMP-dependent transcriptional regulator
MSYETLHKDTWKTLFSLGVAREFEAGEVIYFQDEPGVGLVGLEQGKIKNCVFFPDGTEKILCILEAPSMTGETAVIDGGSTICSAIAVCKTKVVFIPVETAREFLLSNPGLMMIIMNTMAKKMRSIQMQAEDMASNIPQRLARMLLNCNKYGMFTHKEKEKRLIITHDELANFLGTTRPKITEHLNIFMKQGLIDKGRGYITIKNGEGLKKISQTS